MKWHPGIAMLWVWFLCVAAFCILPFQLETRTLEFSGFFLLVLYLACFFIGSITGAPTGLDARPGPKTQLDFALADRIIVIGATVAILAFGVEFYQGNFTDLSAAYSRRFYEVQKFGTVLPYFTVYFHLYANPKWWEGLKPEYRAAIEAAAAKNEQDVIALTEETAAAAVGQLREKGMQITVLSPGETAAWKAKMQQAVIDAFLKISPENGAKIIELMNKI